MILLGDHDFNAKIAFRKILIYSPLFMGFTIIFIESLGFIGLIDSSVQLGSNINLAKNNLFSSPWASLWPGLGLWILIIGFFSLYFGLKEPAVFNFRRNKK
jgi:peptide/nickel transport system permease protein